MSKYSINDTTLDNIAAPIMSMRGLTGGLTPEEMGTNANAVLANVTDALDAIAEKGVDITGADSDDLAALIAQISGGGACTNGEFTVAAVSSGTAKDVTVTHNFGRIPNIAVAINSSLAAQQVAYGSILVYAYIDGVSYSAVSKNSNSITVTKSTRADITEANTGFGSATEESVVFKKGGSGYSAAKTYYYILGAI